MIKLKAKVQGHSLAVIPKSCINTSLHLSEFIFQYLWWTTYMMNSSEESVLLLVSFIILTLIVTLAAYLCSTDIPRTTPSVPAAVTHSNHTTITVEAPEPCIDQSVCNFPNLQFSKTKLCGSTSSSSSSCSICLMDYKDRDSLRVLPACGHFFHVKCVDPWLRINMTCPVCRTPITLSDVTKTF